MAKRFFEHFGEFLRMRLGEAAAAAGKVEVAMATAANDFEQRVRRIGQDLLEEERTEFYNEMAGEDMFFSIAEQFARRAMLVAAYAHFEDSLKRLCKHVFKLRLTGRGVQEKGFYIGQARKYLSSVTVESDTFRVAAFGRAWSEIDGSWRLLRNNLMHDNGILRFDVGASVPIDDAQVPRSTVSGEEAVDAAQIMAFVEGRPDLRLEFGELILDAGAVDSFFTAAAEAVDDIFEEIIRIAPPSPPEPQVAPR